MVLSKIFAELTLHYYKRFKEESYAESEEKINAKLALPIPRHESQEIFEVDNGQVAWLRHEDLVPQEVILSFRWKYSRPSPKTKTIN